MRYSNSFPKLRISKVTNYNVSHTGNYDTSGHKVYEVLITMNDFGDLTVVASGVYCMCINVQLNTILLYIEM